MDLNQTYLFWSISNKNLFSKNVGNNLFFIKIGTLIVRSFLGPTVVVSIILDIIILGLRLGEASKNMWGQTEHQIVKIPPTDPYGFLLPNTIRYTPYWDTN